MASCSTPQWSTSYTPQVTLTVWESSSTATTATLSWKLQYVTHGYAASTNGVGRSYTVKIGGTTVKTGTYNINGKYTSDIASGTHVINKTTSAQTISFSVSFYFDVTWTGVYGGTKSASGSISVAKKTSYTIAYNANGGSGAPSSQTKWHGTALTLSSTKPTRTGYTFQGWATSSTGSVVYAAGASYTANTAATLYAVWKAITYTVTFNANGGTGAPANQTKTYGVNLTLSSTKPTRTNYNFLGWGTSASSTSVAYAAGGSYTSNAAITLYAIWELAYVKPRIDNEIASRCDSAGNETDDGLYGLVIFDWATDVAVSSITIRWKPSTETSWPTDNVINISASGTSGKVTQVIGSGALDTELTYEIKIEVVDTVDSSPRSVILPAMILPIDFKAGGKGAAIGKPSEEEYLFDIEWTTYFRNGIRYPFLKPGSDMNDVTIPNVYYGNAASTSEYVNCPLTTGTSFTLEVYPAGDAGQLFQRLTSCSKTGLAIYQRHYYSSSWGDWIKTY